MLPLGFGEAGIPIHPALTRELGAAAGRGGYGPVAGSAALRAAAAGYWGRRGLPTDPGTVVAGPGSKPLLFALLTALGGDVVVAAPSWVSYAAQASLAGLDPIRVATPPGEGGVPSPALLADAVVRARARGRDVRAVVVTLPDNPTGTIASEATVRRLCAVAREQDLVVISDEIYRDLVHAPGGTVPSPAQYAPERTVVTTSLSKSLAAGGWRIGVARLPEGPFGRALRDSLMGVASEIWSSAPAPMQHAAAFAFAEPPNWSSTSTAAGACTPPSRARSPTGSPRPARVSCVRKRPSTSTPTSALCGTIWRRPTASARRPTSRTSSWSVTEWASCPGARSGTPRRRCACGWRPACSTERTTSSASRRWPPPPRPPCPGSRGPWTG